MHIICDKKIFEAARVRREVLRLRLERPAAYDGLTDAELTAIWNGFGPDSWPQAAREALTAFFAHFQPVAQVHDVEFHFSDGTESGWLWSLERWRRNTAKVLDDRWPLTRPTLWRERLRAWLRMRAAYRALRWFSLAVWEEAAERRVNGGAK